MSQFNHDDPRLTAYVLGELEPAERAAVEWLLAESTEAQAAVSEIRRLTADLTDHLRAEPMPVLTLDQRETVMSEPRKSTPSRPSAAPNRAGNAPVVIAACLMLFAVGGLIMYGGKSTSSDGNFVKGNGKEASKNGIDEKGVVVDGTTNSMASYVKNVNDLKSVAAKESKQIQEELAKLHLKQGNLSKNLAVRFQPSQPQRGYITRFGRPSRTTNYSAPVAAGMTLGGRTTPLYTLTSPQAGGNYLGGQGRWGYPSPNYGLINNTTSFGTTLSGGGGRGMGGLSSYDFAYRMQGMDRGRSPFGVTATRVFSEHRFFDESRLRRLEGDLKPGDGKNDPKSAKPQAQEFFKKSHVAAYRKNVDVYFDTLAKRLPNRELTVTRVKTRLDGKLAKLEQLVEVEAARGKKIALAEGAELVVKVMDAELGDVDFDGDGRKDFSAEAYDTIVENKFLTPLADPLSTFSIDVDTASYSNTRRFLAQGQLPPRDAVRIEELVNYFNYDYPEPKSAKDPFSVTLETGPCPWNPKHRLVMVGLKGRDLPQDKRPASNLVFLIDVSGSMKSANKLPLVKMSLEILADQMTPADKISIVTYSGKSNIALEPTNADKDGKEKIITAIHSLKAGGSTNGASGIQMAYDQARKGFLKKGANRVVLCTDGDFNVGISDDNDLIKLIQKEAKSNVFLSVFGFGMRNLKDAKLEKLADKGDGHYGYIDGFREAKKVFVEELTGMLYTIAKDVKIQVEFNPSQVGSYRLVGYENRMLAAQDFNNDKKDAGEIGAGHTVTALYEIVPKAAEKKPTVDALKYQKRVAPSKDKPVTQEMLTVKLRYKQPDGDKSTKIEFPLTDKADAKKMPSENFDWASAVAMYGLLLRESKYSGEASLDLVRELAAGSMGKDPEGHRSEFLKLVHQTRSLVARKLGKPVPAPRAFEAGALNTK